MTLVVEMEVAFRHNLHSWPIGPRHSRVVPARDYLFRASCVLFPAKAIQ
jgi:hypothetical protein